MLNVIIILYYLHQSLGYKMTVQSDFQIDSSFIQAVIKAFNIPNYGILEYDTHYPSFQQLLEDDLNNGNEPNDNEDDLPDKYGSKYARLFPGVQPAPYPAKHTKVPAFKMDDLLGTHTDKYAVVWMSKYFGPMVKRLDRIHYLSYATPFPDDLIAQRIKDMAILRNVYIVSYGGKPSLSYWSNHTGEYPYYRPRCFPGNRIDRPDHNLFRMEDLSGNVHNKTKFIESLKTVFALKIDSLDYDDYFRFGLPYPEMLIDKFLNDTAESFDVRIKSYGGRSPHTYWSNYPFGRRTDETKIAKEDLHGKADDIRRFLSHKNYFKYEVENLDAVHYKKHGTPLPENLVAQHLNEMARKYNVIITPHKVASGVDQTK